MFRLKLNLCIQNIESTSVCFITSKLQSNRSKDTGQLDNTIHVYYTPNIFVISNIDPPPHFFNQKICYDMLKINIYLI